MSQPRKRSDVERTREMLDLVRQRYDAKSGMTRSWVACEEVADGTGFAAGRFADVLALAIWPSLKHRLIGYEVKASRADLKKELSDLTKHEAIARYCHEWWLVAWDESVLVEGIPESWGIILTREENGERELVTKRKAALRTPVEWDRDFIASLVRNAYDQSPRADEVTRVALRAERAGRRDAESTERAKQETIMRPLATAFYGKDSWRWPKEARDHEHLIKLAVERLQQNVLPLGASQAGVA